MDLVENDTCPPSPPPLTLLIVGWQVTDYKNIAKSLTIFVKIYLLSVNISQKLDIYFNSYKFFSGSKFSALVLFYIIDEQKSMMTFLGRSL